MSYSLRLSSALLVAALMVLSCTETELRAQTHADSLSLARAVLERFDQFSILSLRAGEDCTELQPCTAERILAEWRALEPSHQDARADLPPCRRGQDSTAENAGYRLSVYNLIFESSSARVTVERSCVNPPGSAPRSFSSGEELLFEKIEGEWRFTGVGLRWIT